MKDPFRYPDESPVEKAVKRGLIILTSPLLLTVCALMWAGSESSRLIRDKMQSLSDDRNRNANLAKIRNAKGIRLFIQSYSPDGLGLLPEEDHVHIVIGETVSYLEIKSLYDDRPGHAIRKREKPEMSCMSSETIRRIAEAPSFSDMRKIEVFLKEERIDDSAAKIILDEIAATIKRAITVQAPE